MQKGEQNKNGGTKIIHYSESPKQNWWGQCKCKKVTGTKIGGHCQPLGDGDPKCKCKKVSRTKIAEQKLVGTLGHWVMGTPSASTKRSVEQKLWNKNCRTKIGGDSWPLGDGDPKCKCKKVSRTKIAEQKIVEQK